MNTSSIKKIINNSAPALTGALTSIIMFVYRSLNGQKEYEYIIPLLCGGICTLGSVWIMEIVKARKEKTRNKEVEKLADTIKDKHVFYSEQIKLHEKGSQLFHAYEHKILELITMEHQVLTEQSQKVKDLNMEISVADSFIEAEADRLSKAVNGKTSS